jgi:hypothetical protein
LVAKGSESDVQIYLLRPTWWLEQIGVVVGETIDLSMPEMGVNGPAKVLAIMPTKADSRKNTDPRYKAVTGKFVHDNAEVINLYFTHQETEPLGVTPNHLLWSVTHGGWMHAGDLKVGDTVKTKNGTETLTKKENKPGRHPVYNLEVHQSHTYYVSNIGVLAHNEYAKPEKLGLIKRGHPDFVYANKSDALKQIKQDLKIPHTQQPIKVKNVVLNDKNGNRILDANHKVIMTKEYTYKRVEDGKVYVIQNHQAGQGGIGDQGAHFNVRPGDNTQTGNVQGINDHYYFLPKGK